VSTGAIVRSIAKRAWHQARRALHAVGLEVHRYPPRDPPSYSLAQQLRELLEVVEVDGVVDVGAHVGEFARFLRDTVGYEGPIVSFEPSRSSYRQLVSAMSQDEGWRGEHLALGAVAGQATLNVFDSTNLNSFSPSSMLGYDELDMEVRLTEVVEVRRLDEVELPTGCLVLKTDTQGHDLEVIEGAGEVLARTAAIVIESPVRGLYEGVPVLGDILDRLGELGFEVSGLYPVLRAKDRVHAIEFDGLFVPSVQRTDGRSTRRQ
jgi:FkbM family methyltransferase